MTLTGTMKGSTFRCVIEQFQDLEKPENKKEVGEKVLPQWNNEEVAVSELLSDYFLFCLKQIAKDKEKTSSLLSAVQKCESDPFIPKITYELFKAYVANDERSLKNLVLPKEPKTDQDKRGIEWILRIKNDPVYSRFFPSMPFEYQAHVLKWLYRIKDWSTFRTLIQKGLTPPIEVSHETINFAAGAYKYIHHAQKVGDSVKRNGLEELEAYFGKVALQANELQWGFFLERLGDLPLKSLYVNAVSAPQDELDLLAQRLYDLTIEEEFQIDMSSLIARKLSSITFNPAFLENCPVKTLTVTGGSLERVAFKGDVKRVKLFQPSQESVEVIAASFPNLKHLHLGQAGEVKELDLGALPIETLQIDSFKLNRLPKLEKLKKLTLNSAHFGAALPNFSRLFPHLEELNLRQVYCEEPFVLENLPSSLKKLNYTGHNCVGLNVGDTNYLEINFTPHERSKFEEPVEAVLEES